PPRWSRRGCGKGAPRRRVRRPASRHSRARRAGKRTPSPRPHPASSPRHIGRLAAVPRALVTGGAGFIGSALVRALAAAGVDARVLDDLSSGSPANLEGTGAELVTGDVRDLDLVVGAAGGCDVVFHLAAGAGVVESMNDPLTNFDQNARGTLTALEAARRADVPRLVFSSSNAPLGENAYPASEDKPVAP